MKKNRLLITDSYKTSHYLQYPPGTSQVYSYIESRGGEYDATVFFGLQAFLKEYFEDPITMEEVEDAREVLSLHGVPFNYEGWKYIVEEHKGMLPIIIRAPKEGTVIPVKNVLVAINNLDDNVPWLTSYVETALLRAIWYPTTVATISYNIKKVIEKYLKETSDVPVEDQIDFKLHDFGARGASSSESAMLGGMGHLLSFKGTDNLEAIMGAREYYHCDMAGFSIPASEHSTITVWKREHEKDAYQNMITQFDGEGKIFACVSDSYNIYEAISSIWGNELHEEVKNLKGTLVVRPDSGDPEVVPVECIEKLMDKFGFTMNSKGYKVLPPYLRVIQGDGVNQKSITKILENMKTKLLSAENIAFGMGGALLQEPTRDTQKFAMKASNAFVNKKNVEVYKDPVHDSGKSSKKGFQFLLRNKKTESIRTLNAKEYYARPFHQVMDEDLLLEIVYLNGRICRDDTFETIRENVK